MTRPCPREILERLAEAAVAYHDRDENWEEFKAAMQAFRSATAPLRTREEVDAEIAKCVREEFNVRAPGGYQHIDWTRVVELCCEQTSGPSGVDAASPPRAPLGATYSGPGSASATKESSDNAGAPAGAAKTCGPERVTGSFMCMQCGRENEYHRDACRSCGAARPVTETQPDPAADRDCNCDQAVELARLVKECRRLAQEIVVATEGAG